MRGFKRKIWKLGIILVGLSFLLVLMVLIPMSTSAYEGTSGQALTGLVMTAPTVDVTATITALNEEKLQHENDWWWSYGATILSGVLSALVLVGGGLFGFWQWRTNRNDTLTRESNDRKEAQDKELRDREDARRKELEAQDKELRAQAEERFKTPIAALGDENEATQVGGAILLRSFLHEDEKKLYGRYYAQIFDLAVAYLRPSNEAQTSRGSIPMPLTSLRHALVVVLQESYALVRDALMNQKKSEFDPRFLNASYICLDGAYLVESDLNHIWMTDACLIDVKLGRAKLHKADLRRAIIRDTFFNAADLSESRFFRAIFDNTDLSGADLRNADLRGVKFNGSILTNANLSGADLGGLTIRGDNIRSANLEDAQSLENTDLRGVKGLSKEQLKACKAKGAIIDDEDTPTSAPQPTVSPSAPEPRDNQQTSPTTPAQANAPSPDKSGKNVTE